uniref:ZP domain-containing protein n=1 Tax=Macrostomum lignano TaxID=282301 RepID=A0A1I8H0B7_9PLAT
SAVPKSGFNASFQSPRQGTGLHLQQTGSFPAFRLGGSLPTVYFACTVRICQESDPDFGVRELDEEIRLVVIAKHQAKRSEISDAVCKYSMCLSTSQVIIIILILLVLLALLSGLIIVVYRRRIIMSAARRLRMSGSAGANAGNDEDTPMQTPIDAIGKGPPTCLHHGNQQAGYHQHCGHPGGYRQQQHCTTLPRIP